MAEMTFTIAGGPGVEVHVVEENGSLRFTLSLLGEGGLTGDLRGFFFQLSDESLLKGLTLTDDSGAVTEFRARANSVIDLGQGANMQGAAGAFDVGVEIGTAGAGRDDYHSASFVLSNANHALSLDLIAEQQFGVRMTSVGVEGGPRTDGLKLVGTAGEVPTDTNQPPVAKDDVASTDEDAAITIDVLGNDSDPDNDPLAVSLGATKTALGATVTVNADGTIHYDPTGSATLAALNTGDHLTDSFSYTITDAQGAQSTATVEVNVAGVTDVVTPVDGFLGKTVDYTFDYPGSGFSFNTDITVTNAVELPDFQAAGSASGYTTASLNITDTQLIFDFAAGSSFFFSDTFNGIRIEDQFDVLAAIKSVTINTAESTGTLAGFDAGDISWTENSIAVDFGGVSYESATGPHLVLDVIFA
ncbi:cadherin-like domain-containing protein [Neoroseomonas oryzicola]|uniref:Cadherin-like domain-containing protein n=1 Tax=Neoroseomonas oryzicola TaxID=535904 RepID=A0A9X9WPV4_9PROT|nr:cadherin-like domain-containing protein [Neoroseomonas oryzicola]MBR0662364.1 hypothetical protein [Neoroseomonas oryzicola]NKE19470.1 cadherin-like domain-containing protein [Neoroseomonas oryzicola]